MYDKIYRRRLWEAVGNQWLSCLQKGATWQALLAEPPFYLPPDTGLQFHAGEPLTTQAAKHTQASSVGYTRDWLNVGVHTTYAPYMGFLLDGEMDLRIGITQEHASQHKGRYRESDYATLALKKQTFFLMPPGTPYARGLHGHWERDSTPPNETRIFWIHFLAPGVQCHLSWNSPTGYVSKGGPFLPDPHLLPAVNALTAELRLRRESSLPLIHSLLLFIGYSIERDLKKLLVTEAVPMLPEAQLTPNSQIVEQACAYIETNYPDKLTIGQIASNCFVSPSHLSRLFKAAKGETVSEYITRIRLEYACSLLQESQIGIHGIGRFAGYSNRAHFCQAFSRRYGCSPMQYRKKVRLEKSEHEN